MRLKHSALTDVRASALPLDQLPVYRIDMKRTAWILTLMLSVCAVSDAQDVATKNCPTLSVRGPAGITSPGERMVFVADVSGLDVKNLSFRWTVSLGNIVQGTDSPVIFVVAPTDQNNINITATVTVSGFPIGCPSLASETAPVYVGDPIETDTYGPLSITDETARLQAALQMATKQGDLIAVIMVRTPKQSRVNFNSRVRSISRLMHKLKVSKERYAFVDGGNGELQTTIYLLPKDAVPNLSRN